MQEAQSYNGLHTEQTGSPGFPAFGCFKPLSPLPYPSSNTDADSTPLLFLSIFSVPLPFFSPSPLFCAFLFSPFPTHYQRALSTSCNAWPWRAETYKLLTTCCQSSSVWWLVSEPQDLGWATHRPSRLHCRSRERRGVALKVLPAATGIRLQGRVALESWGDILTPLKSTAKLPSTSIGSGSHPFCSPHPTAPPHPHRDKMTKEAAGA